MSLDKLLAHVLVRDDPDMVPGAEISVLYLLIVNRCTWPMLMMAPLLMVLLMVKILVLGVDSAASRKLALRLVLVDPALMMMIPLLIMLPLILLSIT